MTAPAAQKPKFLKIRRVSIAELERPCPACGHQNAVHTGGAPGGGWAIYVPEWAEASGWCNHIVNGQPCRCRARVVSTPTDGA